MILRPYQERAVNQVLDFAERHISGRVLLVVPGGGGKTLIGATLLRLMAVEQRMRGLVWAHRRELVDGMYDHLIECGVPRSIIGVIMANDARRNPGAPVQVASVDTLHHRSKPMADMVVSDEAHRDASDGRRKLRAMYPDALHVGLTATPCRIDGRGLGNDYDHMIIVAQPSELIASGHLAPSPRIFTVPDELLPDLKCVKVVGGDYDSAGLERAANRRALVGSIVDEWKRLADRRRTIVFPVGLEHSRSIVSEFRRHDVAAEHLDGETALAERRRILEELAAGTVHVVSSCGVLSEGVNVPAVKCVVMARPTKSLALMIQQASRAMRPWRGVVPTILDHAGNVVARGHGLPHEDRAWSLSGDARGFGGQPVRVCDGCGAVLHASARACHECGLVGNEPSRVPAVIQSNLVEYKQPSSCEGRRAAWDDILRTANGSNAGTEWALRVYRSRFKEEPQWVE